MRPQPLSPEVDPQPAVAPELEASPGRVSPHQAEPSWRRAWHWTKHTLLAALVGVALVLVAILIRIDPVSGVLAIAGVGVLVVTSLIGPIFSITTLAKAHRGSEPAPTKVKVGAWAVLVGGALFFFGSALAVLAIMMNPRGRQLRKRGKVLLPEVAPGADWAHLKLAPNVPPELRGELAARWRENGRTEHASVAAFAKLTLELIALGAPPRLLHDAQGDAADEIRHAELCFSLARGLDGEARSPAPFAPAISRRWLPFRTLALARLAVESLIDGALHEGLSARVIAKLVPHCEVPEIRSVLKELAADEGKHCAHGWDVAEWCLAEGGWPVAQAFRGALRRLPETMRAPKGDPASAGEWERFGIPGHALEAQEYARARAELIRRVEPLCAATAPAAASC